MTLVTAIPIFGTLAVFWVLGNGLRSPATVSGPPAAEQAEDDINVPSLQMLTRRLREAKWLDVDGTL